MIKVYQATTYIHEFRNNLCSVFDDDDDDDDHDDDDDDEHGPVQTVWTNLYIVRSLGPSPANIYTAESWNWGSNSQNLYDNYSVWRFL